MTASIVSCAWRGCMSHYVLHVCRMLHLAQVLFFDEVFDEDMTPGSADEMHAWFGTYVFSAGTDDDDQGTKRRNKGANSRSKVTDSRNNGARTDSQSQSQTVFWVLCSRSAPRPVRLADAKKGAAPSAVLQRHARHVEYGRQRRAVPPATRGCGAGPRGRERRRGLCFPHGLPKDESAAIALLRVFSACAACRQRRQAPAMHHGFMAAAIGNRVAVRSTAAAVGVVVCSQRSFRVPLRARECRLSHRLCSGTLGFTDQKSKPDGARTLCFCFRTAR